MKPSEYIAKGWCQGQYAIHKGLTPVSWCLIGAIQQACNTSKQHEIVTKLRDKIGHLRFAEWNDNPKRTQAQVIKLLQSIGE